MAPKRLWPVAAGVGSSSGSPSRVSARLPAGAHPRRCHCYSNAAAWRNRPYYRVKTGPSPPNLHQTVARTARAALDLVAQRVAAVAAGVPLSEAPNEFVTFRA